MHRKHLETYLLQEQSHDQVKLEPWIAYGLVAYQQQMGITRSPLPHHQGKLPIPLFGGQFSVILHDFMRKNYHKTSKLRYPFPLNRVNYPIFSLNYHILYYLVHFQYFSLLPNKPNNVSKMGNILQFLGYSFLQKRLFLIFRIVFNNIPSTFRIFFSSKCIFLYVLISEQFTS